MDFFTKFETVYFTFFIGLPVLVFIYKLISAAMKASGEREKQEAKEAEAAKKKEEAAAKKAEAAAAREAAAEEKRRISAEKKAERERKAQERAMAILEKERAREERAKKKIEEARQLKELKQQELEAARELKRLEREKPAPQEAGPQQMTIFTLTAFAAQYAPGAEPEPIRAEAEPEPEEAEIPKGAEPCTAQVSAVIGSGSYAVFASNVDVGIITPESVEVTAEWILRHFDLEYWLKAELYRPETVVDVMLSRESEKGKLPVRRSVTFGELLEAYRINE